MMGTTAELQQALYAAKSQGLVSVAIPGEDKVIWYVRRQAGLETKTVASLASLAQYWALTTHASSPETGTSCMRGSN
jgi:hypothetical protein